jgi:Zn-dependent protease with chaperone function
MRIKQMSRLHLVGLLTALLSSPALADATENTLPPYVAAYEPQSVDERGLWSQADEIELYYKRSELRIEDEELTAFVRRVLCDTVGADRCNSVRIYILNVPAFNASMMPNGAMMIWSGLFLRTRNEAALASVLGHEFAHFELRHSLQGFKNQRTSTDLLAWTTVLGRATLTDTYDSQVTMLGSIYSFDRELEREADLLSLRYLAQSPYPSRAASEVWQHLMEEADATAAGRKLKRTDSYRAGFFATHPTNLERADYLLQRSIEYGDAEDPAQVRYFEKIHPWLPKLLEDQVRLNDFGGTEYILASISSAIGWTPELQFARAELFANRGNPRDLITATTLYLDVIEKGHKTPAALRGAGLSLVKSGRRTEGADFLRQYLALQPNAPDASLIRMYIPAEDE